MGMPRNSGTHAQGFLDQLSTEQLIDLLRTEPEDGDDGLTDRILEVIEEREKTEPSGLFPDIDVDRAWEDFQKYFNTPDGTDRPLYPTKDPEEGTPETAPARGRGRLLRRLLPLAAVIAVTFFGMVAAQALGMDVFGMLARWTSETFNFVPASAVGMERETVSPENEAIRLAFQDALDQCGITAVSAPSWYPEGSELIAGVVTKENRRAYVISCDFTYGGQNFSIRVYRYLMVEGVPELSFEKDDSNVEAYHSAGRSFYLVENLSESYATYSDGITIMTINGKLSMEDFKKIIDSIGE